MLSYGVAFHSFPLLVAPVLPFLHFRREILFNVHSRLVLRGCSHTPQRGWFVFYCFACLCCITEYLTVLLYLKHKFIILRKSLSSRQTLGLQMARLTPPTGQSPTSPPLATYENLARQDQDVTQPYPEPPVLYTTKASLWPTQKTSPLCASPYLKKKESLDLFEPQ